MYLCEAINCHKLGDHFVSFDYGISKEGFKILRPAAQGIERRIQDMIPKVDRDNMC